MFNVINKLKNKISKNYYVHTNKVYLINNKKRH